MKKNQVEMFIWKHFHQKAYTITVNVVPLYQNVYKIYGYYKDCI